MTGKDKLKLFLEKQMREDLIPESVITVKVNQTIMLYELEFAGDKTLAPEAFKFTSGNFDHRSRGILAINWQPRKHNYVERLDFLGDCVEYAILKHHQETKEVDCTARIEELEKSIAEVDATVLSTLGFWN